MPTIVPWCTRDDLLNRMGEEAGRSGLSPDKLDAYASMASELLWEISGRQFRGLRDRTVIAQVGRSRGIHARVTLSAWWPVLSVADVYGIPQVGDPILIDPADWSWNGSSLLAVPTCWSNLRIRALIRCGQDPPASGINAATALGVELAFADPSWDGEGDTRLPTLVTSVSRQGVSQTFATVLDVLKEGATGIAEVDQFLMAYNRIKVRSRPRVRVIR